MKYHEYRPHPILVDTVKNDFSETSVSSVAENANADATFSLLSVACPPGAGWPGRASAGS
jgi:hypothetical protein